MRKSTMAGKAQSPPDLSARYNAYAISTYKAVQTGPNSQFGGLKVGLMRCAYQVSTFGIVAKVPAAAAANTGATAANTNSREFVPSLNMKLSYDCVTQQRPVSITV